MFRGVTSHHRLPPVSNYAEAQAALEAFEFADHKVVLVRYTGTGIIAFRLYETDVVTWHPDNSFVIRNHGSVTTTEFASHFMPKGVHLNYPTKYGGHRTIMFVGKLPGAGWWWEGARLCSGKAVRFVQVGDEWLPDESTCDPMLFPEVDQRGTRAVSKKFNLADFKTWLSVAPYHLDLCHEEWDVDECALGLEERDLAHVAAFMPIISDPGFGADKRLKKLPIKMGFWQNSITLGCVRKLKLALWERQGLIGSTTLTTPLRSEFQRRMARMRALAALGADVSEYGPQE